MNLATIGSRVQTLLRQVPGTLGLYTSAELSAAINDAQLQVCIDTNYLKRFGSVYTVSGTYRYALSATTTCPDLLSLYNIFYNDRLLGTARPDDPRWSYASDRVSGTPYLYRMWNQQIELFPTPTESKEIRILYSGRPADLALSADIPEVPPEYQQAMIMYACGLLSVKDEKESRYNTFYLKYANIVKTLCANARGFDSDDSIPVDPAVNSARRHTY